MYWLDIVLSKVLPVFNLGKFSETDKTHVCMKPHRPSMTNGHSRLDGNCFQTSSLKQETICMNLEKKSKHPLGSEVSWFDHRLAQTPKEAFSEVRVHAGTLWVDFEADRQPHAYSPRGDHLITTVKETVKKSFEKLKKK